MKLYLRGQTWWVDHVLKNGTRIRKSLGTSSKREAQHLALIATDSTPQPVQKDVTYAEFISEWILMIENSNRPSSMKEKESTLRLHLLPFFGKMYLQDITRRDIEFYKLQQRKRGFKEKSINNQLGTLSKSLNDAMDLEYIERAPRITWLKEPPPDWKYLTPKEADALLDAIDEPLIYEMVLVALRTGLRYGELTALDWSDVDLKRRQMTVRRNLVNGIEGAPKNNRHRHIPLTDEVVATLARRQHKTGRVFQRKRKPVGKMYAFIHLKDYCRKAGIKEVSWHPLRHTYASHLACEGFTMKAIQELLGHASVTMTERYAHFSPSVLAGRINILDEISCHNLRHNSLMPSEKAHG